MSTDIDPFPSPQLYLAPMMGITNHIFRNTFAEYFGGFDLAIAPFIVSNEGTSVKNKQIKDLLPANNTRHKVVPQILGNNASQFNILANHLYSLGHSVVNWNLGCPSPLITRKQKGSGLLPHTEAIQFFLDDVVPRLHGQLSVKIRLGWAHKNEILRLIPILNVYPLSEIIIHPRTGIQRYQGAPDLEAFAQCADLLSHPVVYNGDIRTLADYLRLSQKFPKIHRWMIGRGCLTDPFLPARIKLGTEPMEIKTQVLKEFHGTLCLRYAKLLNHSARVLNKMKGLWRHLAPRLKDPYQSIPAIKRITSLDPYITRVNRFFDEEAIWIEQDE